MANLLNAGYILITPNIQSKIGFTSQCPKMKEYFEGIKKFYKRKKTNPDFIIVRHTDLIQDNKAEIQNTYFQERSRRAKIVKRRSNINFFVFHFSSSIMQTLRNFFMKFLVKRKSFVNSYLGIVYKN